MKGLAPIFGKSRDFSPALIWMAAAIFMLAVQTVNRGLGTSLQGWTALILALAGVPMLIAKSLDGVTLIDGRLRRTFYREALELAEKHAGIGRWRIDHSSGLQSWSDSLSEAFLVAHAPVEDERVRRALDLHEDNDAPFSFEMEVAKHDGTLGHLRIFAQNQISDAGKRIETFGVVVDVTRDYQELRQVARARRAAVQEAERAKEMAMTDPLTGLANRRKAMGLIDHQLLRAREEGSILSLVVFDIDHFKKVNDRFGHQTGDQILRRIAKIASENTRAGELVARIGGEEFLWLMPSVPPDMAHRATERLRRAIERGSAAGGAPGVTVSIGYATSDQSSSSLTLFARADAALYAAKNGGRNQIRQAA